MRDVDEMVFHGSSRVLVHWPTRAAQFHILTSYSSSSSSSRHPSHVCTRIPQRLHSAGFHHPWQIPFSPHTSADDEAAGEGTHGEEGGMCGRVVRARTLNILESRAVVGNGLNKEATPATGYNKAPQLRRDGWNINLISMYK